MALNINNMPSSDVRQGVTTPSPGAFTKKRKRRTKAELLAAKEVPNTQVMQPPVVIQEAPLPTPNICVAPAMQYLPLDEPDKAPEPFGMAIKGTSWVLAGKKAELIFDNEQFLIFKKEIIS